MRVLIADDHFDSADALAMFVTFLGHEVWVARGGREALELAESFRPHVAILDLQMPDLHGNEVARRLRQGAGGARPVLIAYSACPLGEESAAEFDHRFVKSHPTDGLEAVLTRCADGLAEGGSCRPTE